MAKFGDLEITEKQITQRMKLMLGGQAMPAGAERARMQRRVVGTRLVELLSLTHAQLHPDLVSAAEIDATLARMEREITAGGGDLDAALRGMGLTRESFRQQAIIKLAQQKVAQRGQVAERAQAFYDEHRAGFDGTRVVIRQILLTLDPLLATEEEHARTQQRLAEIRAAVVAAVLTFEEAVKRYDQRRTHETIAITRCGMIDEVVSDAAFALSPGEMSAPLRCAPGWALIDVVGREPGMPYSLEQALPLIREYFRVTDFQAVFLEQAQKNSIRTFGDWVAAGASAGGNP